MKYTILILLFVFAAIAADVILDPGHGGSDTGASGPSYTEKAANLDVAYHAKSYLESAGVAVGMTRTTDIHVSLSDRCSIANSGGWERFMSIHENAFDGATQGQETFCYGSGSANSFNLRNLVHPELLWAHGYHDRGTKTASYYVLLNTTMPSILGEGSFIDYNVDWDESRRYATNWNDHEGRQGYAYAKGYCNHRGIAPPTYIYGPADSIIVDNGDPEFRSGGPWNSGTYSGGWNGDYLWCDATDSIENWAHWSPYIEDSGEYSVYMWWLYGTNRCDSVFVCVFGVSNDSFFVSQKSGGSAWHYLGNFDFSAGSGGYVNIGDRYATGGDVVIADAVLWIYNGPLGISAAQNIPNSPELKSYPNPFNNTVHIYIHSIYNGICELNIYDICGRLVESLQLPKNSNSFSWIPKPDVSSGVYMIEASYNDKKYISKIVYME